MTIVLVCVVRNSDDNSAIPRYAKFFCRAMLHYGTIMQIEVLRQSYGSHQWFFTFKSEGDAGRAMEFFKYRSLNEGSHNIDYCFIQKAPYKANIHKFKTVQIPDGSLKWSGKPLPYTDGIFVRSVLRILENLSPIMYNEISSQAYTFSEHTIQVNIGPFTDQHSISPHRHHDGTESTDSLNFYLHDQSDEESYESKRVNTQFKFSSFFLQFGPILSFTPCSANHVKIQFLFPLSALIAQTMLETYLDISIVPRMDVREKRPWVVPRNCYTLITKMLSLPATFTKFSIYCQEGAPSGFTFDNLIGMNVSMISEVNDIQLVHVNGFRDLIMIYDHATRAEKVVVRWDDRSASIVNQSLKHTYRKTHSVILS